MIRAILLSGAMLLLAGCNSSGVSTYGEYYDAFRQGISGTFGSRSVTRAEVAAIPYASMGYRSNGGSEAVLVLATDNGGNQLWTSKSHIVIVTQDGRIVRTVGLGHDLGQLAPAAGGTLASPASALRAPVAMAFTADYPDIGIYAAKLSCRLASQGSQAITVLGQSIPTMRVNESCDSGDLGWRFTNSYWLDPASGLVWRSIQHFHPKGGTLETEIFRPPG